MSEAGKVYRYDGTHASVTWSETRCIHASECGHGLPAVFSSTHEPWCQPDNASIDALAAVIDRCPTGALQLHRRDGAALPGDPFNTVTVVPDGPLYVRGTLDVAAKPRETRIALCRCGASKHKPYCDLTHAEIGFKDPGMLGSPGDDAAPPAGAVAEHAPLAISPGRNGPLHCSGATTIVGADGRSERVAETWLCRCGGSSNKPYCDGTHRKNGFEG